MSHMIDFSNGRANVAFVGEVPWHGLGTALTPGAGLEVWTKEAGLGFEVRASVVEFAGRDGEKALFGDRRVLWRDDTGAPLGVVGKDYRTVQPSQVIGFFSDLVAREGWELEVAGSLNGGRRVWALARVGDGAEVIGQDEVRPYLLLGTSYDGGMSTVAKFTAIRVVCNNTLTIATGVSADNAPAYGAEKDKTDGPVVSCVRIPHNAAFDADEVKVNLGIVRNAFDRFLIESRILAATKVDESFVVEFLKRLLPKPRTESEKVEDGRTFQRLLATWRGDVPSATLPEAAGTAWGLLNAVTWDVDHVRGRDATRLSAAWFGYGDGLKSKARDLLVEVCS